MLTKMVNGAEVVMSDAEEAAIRAEWAANAPNPNIAIQAQIDAIERQTMVPRVMREFLLTSAEDMATRAAAAEGTTAEAILAANVGYQKALAVDNAIRALRAQLA